MAKPAGWSAMVTSLLTSVTAACVDRPESASVANAAHVPSANKDLTIFGSSAHTYGIIQNVSVNQVKSPAASWLQELCASTFPSAAAASFKCATLQHLSNVLHLSLVGQNNKSRNNTTCSEAGFGF